jgi:dihydrofolate synthase/folylpolyglutamate synthase
MSRTSLDDWLRYQQQVHPRDIELGLERVRAVWQALGAPPAAPVVITVGGTNGKGSTVAFLDAMLAAMGKRVGCFTSPHLLRYNERVRVAGADVADAELLDAFERIEQARGATPLTYFEFGTLAALWIFSQSKLDAAVLEVGLGGRLDAVNIVDADVAVVTTVDLDHQDWLGADRDSIGREKAGIFRSGRPAIIGMRDPPHGLLHEAQRLGARVLRAGAAFDARVHVQGWLWTSGDTALELPLPALQAPGQIDNAAAALTALYVLRDRLGWNAQALAMGIRTAHVPARLQQFAKPGAAELVIDVGHNPQAARALAGWLAAQPPQPTVAVFGALADKDVDGIAAPLLALISHWHLASLHADTPRGLQAAQLQARTAHFARGVTPHETVADALDAAAMSASNARMLVFGSFFVAAPALVWAAQRGYGAAPR